MLLCAVTYLENSFVRNAYEQHAMNLFTVHFI